MIVEISTGKQVFNDQDLRRLRLTEKQIDLVNSMVSDTFAKTGLLSNGETVDPVEVNGLIRMARVEERYEDRVRGVDVFYYPQTPSDAIKLYLFMQLASLPIGSEILGRGSKQNQFLVSRYLGEEIETPIGITPIETILGILSLQTKALRSDDFAETKIIRDLTREIEAERRERGVQK